MQKQHVSRISPYRFPQTALLYDPWDAHEQSGIINFNDGMSYNGPNIGCKKKKKKKKKKQTLFVIRTQKRTPLSLLTSIRGCIQKFPD